MKGIEFISSIMNMISTYLSIQEIQYEKHVTHGTMPKAVLY